MDLQKICGVCGDKAFGYNFNALTCESCKAFFRRNALRNKNFRCPTNGNCVLTIKTRKYCRRCRLSKCLEIGMKRDWILTEEDKLSKRRGRNHRLRKDSADLDADSSQTKSQLSHGSDTASTSVPLVFDQTGQIEQANNNNNNNNKKDTEKPETTDVKTNIIILPIMPMAMITDRNGDINDRRVDDDDDDGDDHHHQFDRSKMARIQSLNKNEIIKFINEKLGLNLPPTVMKKNGQHVERPESKPVAANNEDSLILGTKNLHLINEKTKGPIISMDSSSSSSTCCNGTIVTNNPDSVENHHLVGSHSSSSSSSSSSSTSSSYSAPSSFPTTTTSITTTDLVSPLSLLHSNDGYNNYNNGANNTADYYLDDNFVNFNFNQCLNNAILETGITSYDTHYNQFHCGPSEGLSQHVDDDVQRQPEQNSKKKSSHTLPPSSMASSASTTMNYDWRISDEVYKNAIELEFTANPLNPQDSTWSDNQINNANANLNANANNNNNFKLNELERKKLQEVNEQLAQWYDVGDNPVNDLIINDVYDGLNYMEEALRKLIMSLKWITSFKNLCQEDQIVLLKRSASTIKFVVNLHFTNIQEDYCMLPNPSDQRNSRLVFEREYLQRTYGVELYSRCRNFCLSFREDWRNDVSILNLLAMILLFYPHRSNLIHREYINLEYLSYCHLLQRYLQSKYASICEAKTIYLNLLSRLQEINYLNDQCMDLVFKLDPKNIGPLISELMNINKNTPAPATSSAES